jgi:hypothetical protein
MDPENADINFDLAEIYQSQGRLLKALAYYKRFSELASPEDDYYVRVAEERISQLREEAALLN